MDKGIRPFVINAFNTQLPQRVNTREGNTAFRKGIIAECMEQFGITLASAATHYNHAFIEARKAAATDETVAALLVGLGRPEDKKGGRKPKSKVEAAADGDDAATMSDVLGSNLLGDGEQEEDAAPAATETPVLAAPAVEKYSVRKVSDQTIVCSDLTLDEANALIAKAAAAKKAKLELAV